MDKFASYELEIDEKNKVLVMEYLQSIKNHVEDNWLDQECYLDIEEMFFEKLSSLKQINELNIKKIISEVWEAEVIFWEWEKDITWNNLNFYQKLKLNSWEYNNDWAIVLGISSLLAKKLGLTVWIVRIILLVLIIFWGLSIWLYFLLWLILPVKSLDYNSKNLTKLLKTQLFYVIKNSIKNIIKSFFLFFPFILKKIFEFIKIIFKNVMPIFRFFAFSFLGLMFLSLILIAVIFLWFYYSDFSIWNLVLFKEISIFWVYWTIFWLITVLILWIWSLFFAFWSKIFNKNLYILSILSFFISIFFFVVTGFDIAKKYIWESTIIQKAEYEFQNPNSEINIDLSGFRNKYYSWLWEMHIIDLKETDENKITFEVENTIKWGEKISEIFENSLNDLEIIRSWNNFSLVFEDSKEFKNDVPFTFYQRKLRIYIPKDLKITIEKNYWYYYLKSNWKYIEDDCYHKTIYFNLEEQKFICYLKNNES